MFEFVSRNKRLLQFLLVLLIAPPFAMWGIESYTRFGAAGQDVASVDGNKITEREFSVALQQQQQRLRAVLGGSVDSALFDSPAMRKEVLEGLITQRLLANHAVRSRLTVSDDQVRETILGIAAFQVEGKFSKSQYEAALRAEGLTPAGFESMLRRDLLTQQMMSAVGDAGIASKVIAGGLAVFRVQQRELSEATITSTQFAARIQPDDAAVKTYYEGNLKRFQLPEKVRFEYVVLSPDVMPVEPSSAEEIKAFYDQNTARWGEPEQRQASHILFGYKQGATETDKAKVREKAAQVLEQVRKVPGSFAELAKKNSDDPGSSAKGGDLGYFSRGMMTKVFEDAAFELKSGETSGLVESEFGLHIIRLTGIRAGKAKTLDQARAEIERELQKQKAGRKFAESAETFSNLVYEQSDSLKPAADKFKLKIQESGWSTRDAIPITSLNHPKLRAALFGDDAIKNKRNTESTEVSRGVLVSARVVEHQPQKQVPLEEVRSEIVKQIVARDSLEMAKKQGAEKLEALRKGEDAGVVFSAGKLVSRDAAAGFSQDALTEAFKVSGTKLPAYVGVASSTGYSLYRISKIVDRPVDDTNQKGIQQELGRAHGALDFRSYVAALRAGTAVDVNQALIEKKPN